MRCEEARELISARIDGDNVDSTELDIHLPDCATCRSWADGAHRLARSSLRAVPEEPPRVPALTTLPKGFSRYRWLRIALGWAGVLLIVLNVPGMVTGGDETSAIHLSRHLHAFSAALGMTFVFVAWRPDRAYGLVPFAATFTVALSVTAVIDLATGESTAAAESPHLIEIAGLVMLWILGVQAGPGRRTVASTGPSEPARIAEPPPER